MPADVYRYFLLFFFCSVLGWLMEVTCKLIQFHRFINRGFLIGPYCPIYGFGAVFVTLLLSDFSAHPAAVFCLSLVICGTLEYLTSYFMEKLFHARWWDYSQKRFNLNGRVCADTLIPFGVLGLALVYLIKPVVFEWISPLPYSTLQTLCLCIAGLMATDACVSATVLGKIRKQVSLSEKDDTEAITKAIRAALAENSALVRRVLHAFPYAKLYNHRVIEKAKAARVALRAEAKRAQSELHAELAAWDAELKAALRSRRKKGGRN